MSIGRRSEVRCSVLTFLVRTDRYNTVLALPSPDSTAATSESHLSMETE